jgi:SAM-dependent methyltransferase
MTAAAESYTEAVARVLAQRTRLRGPEPPADPFLDLDPAHVLMRADPRRPLTPNQEAIVGFIEPQDVVVDVGGGAGRYSLPLALRCREVINIDSSAAMGRAFLANAVAAEIPNVRFVAADWEAIDAPDGTVALVNHVTYLTRDIVQFIKKLERAGSRRVIITVHAPPPTHRHDRLFELVHGEPEARAPGHEALMAVLWELGILPDLRMLGGVPRGERPRSSRREAIDAAVENFKGEQWAFWPYEPALQRRIEEVLEAHFDLLFAAGPEGFVPTWPDYGRDVLITWRPGVDGPTA